MPFVPLTGYHAFDAETMTRRAESFYDDVKRRRTVREFSDRPVPREVIEHCLRAAGTAPNGANLQPWHFVAVADPEIKRQIRAGAEEEEREFYNGKAPQEWLDALAPLGTDQHKPFLEIAPWLIVIFGESYGELPDGRKVKHYYTQESVGIAVGFLLAALHHAGLVALTHTPAPMEFLERLLQRPHNERGFMLIPVGYPAENCAVPDIPRKSLDEVRLLR